MSSLRPTRSFHNSSTMPWLIGGLEFRGEVIRLVRTLRGGDRPKNAEKEFPGVSSLPRGCYEPWGIFRKPLLPRMKVSDCLREYQTGGLRRYPDDLPFEDVFPANGRRNESGRLPGTPASSRNLSCGASSTPRCRWARASLPIRSWGRGQPSRRSKRWAFAEWASNGITNTTTWQRRRSRG